MFEMSEDGSFLFPPENGPVSAGERAFLDRAASLELFSVLSSRSPESSRDAIREYGWYTWFMGDGLNFIFWQTGADGGFTGIELERTAFMSRIVAVLPESSSPDVEEYATRIVLTDARGTKLYQWGSHVPQEVQTPLAEIAVSAPLEAWHLQFYADADSLRASAIPGNYAALASGFLALVFVIVFLAVYFYRENTRMVRDALQKVSFVNQVSHELKTPLTNIRLYAELLDTRIEEKNARSDLGVIIAESSRLGRMINNVLTFARSEKNDVDVNIAETVVDDVIRRVIDAFSPALAEKRFEIVLDCAAPEPIHTDADLLEQILSNLVSNVEKYAVGGAYIAISSRRIDTGIIVTVADKGPGIPARERKRIFEPFYRISNSLTEGVSGAGIGLAISRKLACAIGGTLQLTESDVGAVFALAMPDRIPEEAGS
jgi:signal transduction histidine kinase